MGSILWEPIIHSYLYKITKKCISHNPFGENRLDPEKNDLQPVFLLHSHFLLPSFVRGEEKKD